MFDLLWCAGLCFFGLVGLPLGLVWFRWAGVPGSDVCFVMSFCWVCLHVVPSGLSSSGHFRDGCLTPNSGGFFSSVAVCTRALLTLWN